MICKKIQAVSITKNLMHKQEGGFEYVHENVEEIDYHDFMNSKFRPTTSSHPLPLKMCFSRLI